MDFDSFLNREIGDFAGPENKVYGGFCKHAK